MKVIRSYLLDNPELCNLLGGDYIFLVEKPSEIECKNYIIYKYKVLSGGYVKDYQIEFNIVGKNLQELIQIQNKLIEMLDDPRGEKFIKDTDTTIRYIRLLNGGGMVKNPNSGNYEIIVFFYVKI